MGRFVEGEDRLQSLLLPETLDDYVTEDNPVRVVEVFIEELDLGALGFEGVHPAATGRPGYHPATLLKIYLYGYLNAIQSSRRLEREAAAQCRADVAHGRLRRTSRPSPTFARQWSGDQRCARSSSCCAAGSTCSRTRSWRSTAASSKRSTIATRTSQ